MLRQLQLIVPHILQLRQLLLLRLKRGLLFGDFRLDVMLFDGHGANVAELRIAIARSLHRLFERGLAAA